MHTLEEYIISMENRTMIDNSSVPEDVWAQLQQKDNDLMLAAELGKALLEKNEELKKQQEAREVEFSKKLEVSDAIKTLFPADARCRKPLRRRSPATRTVRPSSPSLRSRRD